MMFLILLTVCVGFACSDFPENGFQEPKIIQGQDANEGEFPFMASLRAPNAMSSHFCGASIITSKWLLSAAHCCVRLKTVKGCYVQVGSIYLTRGGSKHSITDVIMHENYNPDQRWRNDICLIKVAEPFVFGRNIDQITLAPQNWPVKNGSLVTVSGWGRTDPDSAIPDRLQKGVNFTALSMEECNKVIQLEMYGGYLCACGSRKEQCTWNGDSGGPLTLDGAQVGLVSFGQRPYGTGRPTVYSRIPFFVDWIKKTLGADATQLKFRK